MDQSALVAAISKLTDMTLANMEKTRIEHSHIQTEASAKAAEDAYQIAKGVAYALDSAMKADIAIARVPVV